MLQIIGLIIVLLRRLNIVPSYLPKSPSAALSSIAVALATAQSSALHRKICFAQSGAIFNRRSNRAGLPGESAGAVEAYERTLQRAQ